MAHQTGGARCRDGGILAAGPPRVSRRHGAPRPRTATQRSPPGFLPAGPRLRTVRPHPREGAQVESSRGPDPHPVRAVHRARRVRVRVRGATSRGRPSHAIVRDALTVLVNLEHRGASGSEAQHRRRRRDPGRRSRTRFLGAAAAEAGHRPPPGAATAWRWSSCRATRPAATPAVAHRRARPARPRASSCWAGATSPPTPRGLGDTARASQPVIRQAFIARPPDLGRAGRGPRLRAPPVRRPPAGREGRRAAARSPAAATSTSRR